VVWIWWVVAYESTAGLPPGSPIGQLLAVTVGSFALGEVVTRVIHYRRLDRFRREYKDGTPEYLYEVIASRFEDQIEAQRARTLGPDSELYRARSPLTTAADEARRSIAYWRERAKYEPRSDLVKLQLATAEQLASKFESAIRQLDRRSEALLAFFNECEAKLALLRRSSRDIEESKRLSALSSRAESLIADAESVLIDIGRQFVSEAFRMGEALGQLERIQIQQSASDIPIDHLEMVADRIIESAEREQYALSRLFGDETPLDE
jgi:hypothetical protein